MNLVHHDPVFISASTLTDANGEFTFTGVGGGKYLVALDPTSAFPPEGAGGSTYDAARPVPDGSEVTFGPIQAAKLISMTEPAFNAEVSSPIAVRWEAIEHATSYAVWVKNADFEEIARREVTALEAQIAATMTSGATYRVGVDALAIVDGRTILIGTSYVNVVAR